MFRVIDLQVPSGFLLSCPPEAVAAPCQCIQHQVVIIINANLDNGFRLQPLVSQCFVLGISAERVPSDPYRITPEYVQAGTEKAKMRSSS